MPKAHIEMEDEEKEKKIKNLRTLEGVKPGDIIELTLDKTYKITGNELKENLFACIWTNQIYNYPIDDYNLQQTMAYIYDIMFNEPNAIITMVVVNVIEHRDSLRHLKMPIFKVKEYNSTDPYVYTVNSDCLLVDGINVTKLIAPTTMRRGSKSSSPRLSSSSPRLSSSSSPRSFKADGGSRRRLRWSKPKRAKKTMHKKNKKQMTKKNRKYI